MPDHAPATVWHITDADQRSVTLVDASAYNEVCVKLDELHRALALASAWAAGPATSDLCDVLAAAGLDADTVMIVTAAVGRPALALT